MELYNAMNATANAIARKHVDNANMYDSLLTKYP